jgi:tetratricopeptide (TPR) repeat protein
MTAPASASSSTSSGPVADSPGTATTSNGANTSPQARAVVHYERGWAYYASGQYRLASTELETAVRLDPSGYNLYFDLGLVYERLGHVDRAIGAYRRYYASATDAAERERADRIVQRLQGARVELQDQLRRMGRADGWFWGFTIATGVSVVGGGALLFSAIRGDAYTTSLRMGGAPDQLIRAAAASAETQHVVADVLLIGSLALATTSVLLYVAREAPPRNVPVCVTAGLGSFALRF